MKEKIALSLILMGLMLNSLQAVPYFARKYDVSCATCHTHPPHLNQFGLNFVARGYRMDELKPIPAHKTVPLAVWTTQRLEYKSRLDLTKSFPNRIEIVSGGQVSDRVSYFLEWRALSYEMTSSGKLQDRSGRFEDLFLIFQLTDSLSVTAGQFRMVSQWDPSRKLSLSTPVVFSSGIGGESAPDPRTTSLRSFSLEGRAPALRLSAVIPSGGEAADGWFHELTLPFGGEFSAPLTEEARRTASFELESRPKGLQYETYYRIGLNSLGGSLFVGDDRWMANLIAQRQIGRHQIYGGVGTARFRNDLQDFRLSIGDYWIPLYHLALGARLDHRSGAGFDPAFVPHFNVHFPGEKYTFMFVVEPFFQSGNSGLTTELSFVF